MQATRPRRLPPPVLRGQGRLYDATALLVRAGICWMFVEYALDLRGREEEIAAEASGTPLALLGVMAPILPTLFIGLAIAFGVGLLTWLTGPLLAGIAVLGGALSDASDLAPFTSWPAIVLVSAVSLLMAAGCGRWSWDHLVLTPPSPPSPRDRRRSTHRRPTKASTVSPRRPEHAPPLLYPVEQAAFRRPYRL